MQLPKFFVVICIPAKAPRNAKPVVGPKRIRQLLVSNQIEQNPGHTAKQDVRHGSVGGRRT